MERVVCYCYSIHLILSKVLWVGICSHENIVQSTVSWNLSLAGTRGALGGCPALRGPSVLSVMQVFSWS